MGGQAYDGDKARVRLEPAIIWDQLSLMIWRKDEEIPRYTAADHTKNPIDILGAAQNFVLGRTSHVEEVYNMFQLYMSMAYYF